MTRTRIGTGKRSDESAGRVALTLPLALALALALAGAVTACSVAAPGGDELPPAWSQDELATLRSLWIESLPDPPADPSNAVADDPAAARLGHALFFDPALSANGSVSCATCHVPALSFTDGRRLSSGLGEGRRHTPTVVGTAHSPWLFWDGAADSQWAQALVPLENAAEHGGDRVGLVRHVATTYRPAYEEVFGPLPADFSDRGRFPPRAGPVTDPSARAAWAGMADTDRRLASEVFANIGKAIAAYERQLGFGPSRFDEYVGALVSGDAAAERSALGGDEVAGLRLFIGRAQCLRCHNGPLLTNNAFHNTGVPASEVAPSDLIDPQTDTARAGCCAQDERVDDGRASGLERVLMSDFNCLGPYSDAELEACGELRFLATELHGGLTGATGVAPGHGRVGAFRTPTLRQAAATAPFMHNGALASLADVLVHYNMAPQGPVGQTELNPLGLSPMELAQLEAFLGALSGALNVEPALMVPP